MSAHETLRQRVEAAVREGLVARLHDGMRGLGLAWAERTANEYMQWITPHLGSALSAPAPGREEMREGIRSTILDWMQSYDGPLSNEQMAYAVAERILALLPEEGKETQLAAERLRGGLLAEAIRLHRENLSKSRPGKNALDEDSRLYAALDRWVESYALASSPAPEIGQTWWFIEIKRDQPPGYAWWTGKANHVFPFCWTSDWTQAVRFARREDAESVIAGRDFRAPAWNDQAPFATSHSIMDGPSTQVEPVLREEASSPAPESGLRDIGYPPFDAMKGLADFVLHLDHDHDCDSHGWENRREWARKVTEWLDAAALAAPRSPEPPGPKYVCTKCDWKGKRVVERDGAMMHFDVCNRKCGPVVPLTETPKEK